MTDTVTSLLAGHKSGTVSIRDTVASTYERLRQANDPAIFISTRDEADVQAEADALRERDPATMPLYGIPVAVKDNIDVAGLPTTAACPAFAYPPASDATVVRRLREAGALIIGKTNLDQFATGLVGMRSPYGMPRNAMRADLVSGGSSSGSAVAVARGIVPLALGTDTAGSGRVPAGLNNIVGLKPSLGMLPTTGVVPACRSLDCVSIFALTAADAFTALSVMAGFDEADPYSRRYAPGVLSALPPSLRIAVPRAADLAFFGDTDAEASFQAARGLAEGLGAKIIEIDIAPLLETARLLYEGPWVAERTAAVGDFIAGHPDAIHEVTAKIVVLGNGKSAVDTFRGLYRLEELRAISRRLIAGFDALMVPTIPRPATVAEVEADPIGANSRLGIYTNFVNLLDMAGIAVPVSIAAGNMPYGVTLLAPAGQDAALASLGAAIHARTGLPLGAVGGSVPSPGQLAAGLCSDEIPLVVVGAHLSGMPLNGELKALSARFIEATTTAPDYRLFALQESLPPKPGLLRVAPGAGTAIAIEVWAIPAPALGPFMTAIPPPLSIGTVRLADGRGVKGFLVEAQAVASARDISSFGGWREFVARS